MSHGNNEPSTYSKPIPSHNQSSRGHEMRIVNDNTSPWMKNDEKILIDPPTLG